MSELKEIYRGHEIWLSREKCQGGWEQTYYSIFRVADRYECLSDFTTDESPLPELMADLKKRVDEELESPDPCSEG
ncbi:TPA: hypothetical protein ACQVH3_004681 [Serratia marcescens]